MHIFRVILSPERAISCVYDDTIFRVTLSLEGVVSYYTTSGICIEDHLTLSLERAILYDTHNSICVEDHLTMSLERAVSCVYDVIHNI